MGENMRILVTGGAGFIGSNFIRYTLGKYRDIRIVNMDLLTYSGRMENLTDVMKDSRHEFVKGDIRDRSKVREVMRKGFNAVINFAAETHVDRSILEADSFITTDVYGTYILLDTARVCEVEKFIQISTDEVYGSIKKGSFKETDRVEPSSPYSASKTAADLMVLAFHKTYGLPINITRSSNNFGPYQHLEKFVPKMIARALNNQSLPLYGDGLQVRDWLYVIDNCEAIDAVVWKGTAGEIYNIASGSEHTNIECAELILKALKKSKSLITFVPDRPGHDRRYSLGTSKIRNLGWRPKRSFKNAVIQTVKWYIQNEWWWKPLLADRFVQSDAPWVQK
jgi:dTDP-glucose 4,6-dehydratase